MIVVNTTYQIAPWADVLYACDARWWRHHWSDVKKLPARKYSLEVPGLKKPAGVACLRKTGRSGLELDPTGLRHGHNSGYQSINLAVHLGVARILLLGYDMRLGTGGKGHWHPEHPWRVGSSFNAWIGLYRSLIEPLKARGVEVLNCSRSTNLDAFPRVSLETALQAREVAA